MPWQTDEQYFSGRALTERRLSEEASSAEVARIHEELARGYEILAGQEPQEQRSAVLLAFARSSTSSTAEHEGLQNLLHSN